MLRVATPAQLIQDKNRTPFNIGKAIALQGLKIHEAQLLLRGITEKIRSPQVVLREVLNWTGGQPFSSQKICQLIRDNETDIPISGEVQWITKLFKTNIIDNWEAQDEPEHLRVIRDRLLSLNENSLAVLQEYQKIIAQTEIEANNSLEQSELLLSGLVIKRKDKFWSKIRYM